MILHTDGAKAYRLRVEGMKRDRVVHGKKKINGRWVNPKYVEPATHTLPDGSTLRVMKGTQFIDGAWKHLRHSQPRRLDAVGDAMQLRSLESLTLSRLH